MVLLGEGNVGKTSIRRRYLGEGFQNDYHMTLGADIALKRATYDDTLYLIQIWDLGGQSGFLKIRANYYESALGGLLVFDLSKRASFEKLDNWIHEIQDNKGEHIPLILIGNKVDLRDGSDNFVSYEEASTYAEKMSQMTGHKVTYIETSALEGTNIDEAFEIIIKDVAQWMSDKEKSVMGESQPSSAKQPVSRPEPRRPQSILSRPQPSPGPGRIVPQNRPPQTTPPPREESRPAVPKSPEPTMESESSRTDPRKRKTVFRFGETEHVQREPRRFEPRGIPDNRPKQEVQPKPTPVAQPTETRVEKTIEKVEPPKEPEEEYVPSWLQHEERKPLRFTRINPVPTNNDTEEGERRQFQFKKVDPVVPPKKKKKEDEDEDGSERRRSYLD
jgi:small GTP-binding protein